MNKILLLSTFLSKIQEKHFARYHKKYWEEIFKKLGSLQFIYQYWKIIAILDSI